MTTKRFKCTLLSDIILNENSATEGTQCTLDYIPGNVFLGMVASKIYKEMNEESMLIFHSGKVCFGDAYPMENKKKAIRIPASWLLKKGENITKDTVFIHHALPAGGLKDENGQTLPTKQCRNGFVVKVDDAHFKLIEPEKNFTIKSAYNPATRRSKDKEMYGYQSLEAGSELCFQLEFIGAIDEALVEKVVDCLRGERNIGRSRTAQYGRVNIEGFNYSECFNEDTEIENGHTYLYAQSRLVFLDEFGQPTATPTGDQLGIPGASIDLFRSQIRTFRYAPYNYKRQSRDADRFGIEKGSVICINQAISDKEAEKMRKGIGLYRNEGFGKVLINPEFLKPATDKALVGKSFFQHIPVKKKEKAERKKSKDIVIPETIKEKTVFNYLIRSLKEEEENQKSYELVNNFVKDHGSLFQNGESFASQWGTIRMKAVQEPDKRSLSNSLFANNGYLTKGIAASKWEGKRFDVFKEFVDKPETTVKTIINLAAEMAKVCKKEGGNHDNS